jgi:hypothetical protein
VTSALITASAIETPRTNTDLSICPWGQDTHRVTVMDKISQFKLRALVSIDVDRYND